MDEKFMEELKEHLKQGLIGWDVHLNTKKAIELLGFEIANKRIAPNVPTCWELLYHMIYWHKAMIAILKDDKTTFDKYKKSDDMPKDPADETTFEKYKTRFIHELDFIANLIDSTDLSKPAELWNNAIKYEMFQILLQHNSYHLAQIVQIMKILGKKIK
ncbi:MAG: DinB family protein [Asgard group archaeon]|nr:DinB family protein [Asgard group archaeon]